MLFVELRSILDVRAGDELRRNVDHTLPAFFSGNGPRGSICNRRADADEILRHGGFEVATCCNGITSLRVGVHADDDNAFIGSSRILNRLQSTECGLVPGGPYCCDAPRVRVRCQDCFHFCPAVGDAAVLHIWA